MLDERWLYLLVITGLVGVLTRSPTLIGLVMLSATLILVSHWLRRVVLRGVSYRRHFSEIRLFQGETVTVSCTAVNRSRLPLISLHIDDSAPKAFLPAAGDGAVVSASGGRLRFSYLMALQPGEQASRRIRLRSTRRGYYVFDTAALRAADLLGLFEIDGSVDARDVVIVYPQVHAMEELGIPVREPYGALLALRGLIEDPSRIVGARDYHYGDAFRQIHWKATAHHGTLQTRVCEHTSDPTAVVFLNVATSTPAWRDLDEEQVEWAVSVAASIATWAHNSGAVVGLITNGNAPKAPKAPRVPPRRSPNQWARILESLAVVGPYSFFPFEQSLLDEQCNVPSGATQIVVTSVFTPGLEIALQLLHTQGKRVALVFVGNDALPAHGLPFPCFTAPPSAARATSTNPDRWEQVNAAPGGAVQ
ncbi:MAG: DUF58 domain-containing protein [Chloroflexi bacterium]|nr:DUF58 domain-containing protein [Chloroflexota bacterium]